MSKPLIFISCGQYTKAEKALGKSIYAMVENLGMQPFFAEQVQDLKGLNESILDNLRDCVGFITVLHPRGTISRPSGQHTRASVWIEQEIAITAYIQHAEKRPLRVIAFIHEDVNREGIRELLHLNPIKFSSEMEVLTALPAPLQAWGTLKSTGIVPIVKTDRPVLKPDMHRIGRLKFSLANNTSSRITQLNGTIRVPAGILKHWSITYALTEERSDNSLYRVFRFDENTPGQVPPQNESHLWYVDYCLTCGITDIGDAEHISGLVLSERQVELTVWIDGRTYQNLATMKQLLQAASVS